MYKTGCAWKIISIVHNYFNANKLCYTLECPRLNFTIIIGSGRAVYVPLARGSGCQNGGWSCCSSSNQCGIGEGDCDNDSECSGNLVCGTDNCGSNFPNGTNEKGEFHQQDCCTEATQGNKNNHLVLLSQSQYSAHSKPIALREYLKSYRYSEMSMASPLNGVASVLVTSEDSKVYLAVASVPDFFG